jgi:hypothetical protein
VAYLEAHVDERAATPLVLFEAYRGEVFRTGAADLDAVDGAPGWLTVADETAALARAAAELRTGLGRRDDPLAARDAFVAGAAKGLGERPPRPTRTATPTASPRSRPSIRVVSESPTAILESRRDRPAEGAVGNAGDPPATVDDAVRADDSVTSSGSASSSRRTETLAAGSSPAPS